MTAALAAAGLIALAVIWIVGVRSTGHGGAAGSADHTTSANPWTVHGVLRIASQEQPDVLGPMLGEQYIDNDLSMLWAGYLLSWSSDDAFVPDLAAIVPTQSNGGISRDGLTITYHLRRGVTWQDGAPFTAADVAFSYRAVMNPRDVISTRVGYTDIERLQTPDPYTVVVRLKHRYSPFVGTFFAPSAEPVPVMPEHLLARYPDVAQTPYSALPIGTGPFRVVSNSDGRIRFLANPHYWRGAPKLREIDYQWLPDDQALVTALHRHSIDLYMQGAQALEPELEGNRGFTVYLYPFTKFMDIGLNTARAQLRDRRVRQALAFATNRRRLVDHISNGVNLPADSDQPAFSWAHAGDIPKYPYNPRLAERMLDDAGWRLGAGGIRWKDGQPMRLLLVGEEGSATKVAAGDEIRREWRAVGVDVSVRNFPAEQLYATAERGGIQQRGLFDATFEEWGYGVDPDDSQVFMCAMRPPAGWNIYNYCDPALEAAEQTALARYDRAARKAAYRQIQRIVATDLPMIPVWFEQMQDVANIDLQNYKPAHAGSSFWNAWQWSI